MHSSTVMGLMAEAGYDEATQKAVEKLMLKKVLKTPEGQVGSVAGAGFPAPYMHVGMIVLCIYVLHQAATCNNAAR